MTRHAEQNPATITLKEPKKSGKKLNRQESKEKWKRPNQTKNLEGLKIGGRVVLERTSWANGRVFGLNHRALKILYPFFCVFSSGCYRRSCCHSRRWFPLFAHFLSLLVFSLWTLRTLPNPTSRTDTLFFYLLFVFRLVFAFFELFLHFFLIIIMIVIILLRVPHFSVEISLNN